jgi:uncharacterized protein YbaP (TraB family)
MTVRAYLAVKAHKLLGVLMGLAVCATMLSAVLSPLTARAETARPMMWVVKDEDSTLYLFGSIHVMKDDVVWLTPDVQSRFDSASDVWFEVADLDNPALIQPVAQKYMVDPKGRMTKGLTDAEIRKIDELAAPSGLSAQKMLNLRKWAVGLILTMQKIQALGYDPKVGVDVTLMAAARKAGKGVHGFETIDQEMQAIVPANDTEELAALRQSLDEVADANKDIAPLLEAWMKGDEAQLAHFLLDKYKAEDPASYKRLIVARNAAWEPQVEDILKGKGTAFITVGAGHLVGPDSLVAMLRKHGITVTRLE